jgi:hypothetical protein
MRKRTYYAFILITISSIAASNLAIAEDNSSFSLGLAGTQPILWKEYEPLQQNGLECLKDRELESKTCLAVQDRIIHVLSDALLQAEMVNVGNPPSDKFCDEYTLQLLHSKNTSQMAAYAMLLVDDRIKHGSSLYGSNLSETYLGKIVFDSLLAQSPCKN